MVYDELQEFIPPSLVKREGVVKNIADDGEGRHLFSAAHLLETLLCMCTIFGLCILKDKVTDLSSDFTRWLFFTIVFLKVVSSDVLLIH
jgi:hypothetical protein